MSGRVPLARRNILADRRRLLTSVLGVGAAIALILVLQGLWTGFRVQISAYEDHVGADLFVGESGTRNFLGVPSVIPMDTVSAIRGIPGVERADPVAARFAVLDLHGTKLFTFLIGSTKDGMGGPWDLVAGRAVRSDDEVVVDQTVARQHDIGLGEDLQIMGQRFRVVGLSGGTRSWMAGFVFASHEAIERLVKMPGTTSYVLVKANDPARVAEAIRARTGLAVLTPTELGDNDRVLIGRIMNGAVGLMLLIAFAAGTLIIALTVYSAIVERVREFGIVKAMGAGPGRLFGIVLGQSAIIAALGSATGYALFRGASWLVGWVRPQMWVRQSTGGLVLALAAAAVMAVLGTVVPTRRVARLDPASVYRG